MGLPIFAADITFLLYHVLFLLTLPSFQTSPKLIWYDFLSCISCVAAAQQANHYLRMSPFYLGPAGSKSTQTLGGRSSGWVFSCSTSPFCWTLGLNGSLSLISICRSWFGIETVVSLQRFLSINPLRIDEFKILFKSECYDGITGSIPCSWINCIYSLWTNPDIEYFQSHSWLDHPASELLRCSKEPTDETWSQDEQTLSEIVRLSFFKDCIDRN